MVKKPKVDISDVNICELCYLAALIDGEGAVEIHKRDLYPLICIGMRSLLPYELCERHGGVITKTYRKNVPFYTWNIYNKRIQLLLTGLVEKIMPHSKIKKRQLELVLEAIEIRSSKSPGWKEEMRRIKKEIAQLKSNLDQLNSDSKQLASIDERLTI